MCACATKEKAKRSCKPRQRRRIVKNKCKNYKFFRPGPVTRNSFLNFLRDVRKKTRASFVTQISKRGAKVWRQMSEQEKSKYKAMANSAPPYRKKSKSQKGKRIMRSC